MSMSSGRARWSTRMRHLGVAGLVAVSALALPAAAGAADPATSGDTAAVAAEAEVPVRVERACLRIPNLTIRTGNVIDRINGDAETVGSLLWLDERIARAADAGRDQLAEVLENRRAVREASVAVFEQRQDELAALAERCRAAGVDL